MAFYGLGKSQVGEVTDRRQPYRWSVVRSWFKTISWLMISSDYRGFYYSTYWGLSSKLSQSMMGTESLVYFDNGWLHLFGPICTI